MLINGDRLGMLFSMIFPSLICRLKFLYDVRGLEICVSPCYWEQLVTYILLLLIVMPFFCMW